MSQYTVVFCIHYDFVQMCAKKLEIQNDLPIVTQVKLTSYLINKTEAYNTETMFIFFMF